MSWKWVRPLGGLWEGASLGERELPSTREKGNRKRREGRKIKSKETRKERKKEAKEAKMLFCCKIMDDGSPCLG